MAPHLRPQVINVDGGLPALLCRFYTRSREDLPRCDLLIIMGTSLVVHPFAGLICELSLVSPTQTVCGISTLCCGLCGGQRFISTACSCC